MTPAARLQAAIEVLDEVIASARDNGPPADAIVTRYFRTRRYAGSKDRRAVRELVFRAIRRSAEIPQSGRSAIISLAKDDGDLLPLFGQPRGPSPMSASEDGAIGPSSPIPAWLIDKLSVLVGPEEWNALTDRAPLDLRTNSARASREDLLEEFEGAVPTPLSPWGLRLPPDSQVDHSRAFEEGRAEIQDEGSQLVALACEAQNGERILDLCAGAGGKALALAAVAPQAKILATDSSRLRLSKLEPRARRAGAVIETRLLDPPRELEGLADWIHLADLVLVDAPCSGSGTWRRNPEGRWRLTSERLERLVHAQQRLLEIAAELTRPGGRIVYAVCSILSDEGSSQIERFLETHSSWISEEVIMESGRPDGAGRLVTPAHDRTDGFFVARVRRPC